MPTPFTHLIKAQQLMQDERLSSSAHELLDANYAAFLLGNIAPDAHHMEHSSDIRRETTHFFDYAPQIDPLGTAQMLIAHPTLRSAAVTSDAQRVFLAGYLAHLAVDELWAMDVVVRFWHAEWGDRRTRHFAFTSLIAMLDKRDYLRMPTGYDQILRSATPNKWLPFLSDYALEQWRDVVANQIAPDGQPETLAILGRTVYSGYHDLVDMVNSPQRQEAELWHYFPQAEVEAIEQNTYEHMLRVVCDYLQLC